MPDKAIISSITPASPPTTSLQIVWSAVPNAAVYTVSRRTSGSDSYSVEYQGTSTSFIDSELSQNTTYCYIVTSSDDTTSSVSNEVCGTTDCFPTSTPATPTASKTNCRVRVNWIAKNTVDSYIVERSFDNETYEVAATDQHPPFTEAANGCFYYRIIAVNCGTQSSPSRPVRICVSCVNPPINIVTPFVLEASLRYPVIGGEYGEYAYCCTSYRLTVGGVLSGTYVLEENGDEWRGNGTTDSTIARLYKSESFWVLRIASETQLKYFRSNTNSDCPPLTGWIANASGSSITLEKADCPDDFLTISIDWDAGDTINAWVDINGDEIGNHYTTTAPFPNYVIYSQSTGNQTFTIDVSLSHINRVWNEILTIPLYICGSIGTSYSVTATWKGVSQTKQNTTTSNPGGACATQVGSISINHVGNMSFTIAGSTPLSAKPVHACDSLPDRLCVTPAPTFTPLRAAICGCVYVNGCTETTWAGTLYRAGNCIYDWQTVSQPCFDNRLIHPTLSKSGGTWTLKWECFNVSAVPIVIWSGNLTSSSPVGTYNRTAGCDRRATYAVAPCSHPHTLTVANLTTWSEYNGTFTLTETDAIDGESISVVGNSGWRITKTGSIYTVTNANVFAECSIDVSGCIGCVDGMVPFVKQPVTWVQEFEIGSAIGHYSFVSICDDGAAYTSELTGVSIKID